MLKDITAIMNMPENEIKGHPHLLVNAFDKEHRILFWNNRCEQYFGISEENAVGKILEDLIPYARTNKKMEYLQKALSGHPVYIADDQYDKRKGVYDQVVLPLKDADGQVFAALNIVIDLSVIKTKDKRLSIFRNVL